MKDNIFRDRINRDSGLKTIDTLGTTPCSSDDENVRASAHCSAFGAKDRPAPKATAAAKKTTTAKAKASAGAAAARAYDNTMWGENDLPPMGAMAPEKSKPARKPAAKKPHASTVKKSPTAGGRKNDNDDYVVIEEVIIVEEY